MSQTVMICLSTLGCFKGRNTAIMSDGMDSPALNDRHDLLRLLPVNALPELIFTSNSEHKGMESAPTDST